MLPGKRQGLLETGFCLRRRYPRGPAPLIGLLAQQFPLESIQLGFGEARVALTEDAGPCVEEPALVLRGLDGRFTAASNGVCRAMGMPV